MNSASGQSLPTNIWYIATEPLGSVKQFFAGLPPDKFQVQYIPNEDALKQSVKESSLSGGKGNADIILLGDLNDGMITPERYVGFFTFHRMSPILVPFSLSTEVNLGLFKYDDEHHAELEEKEIRVRGLGNIEERDNPTRLFQSDRGGREVLALLPKNKPTGPEIAVAVREQERV